MEEDAEIPYLLWYFMEDNSHGSGKPDRDTHQVTGADDHPVNQIMDAITNYIHGDNGMEVFF